jgi:methyl-accepting chemotaxis protein
MNNLQGKINDAFKSYEKLNDEIEGSNKNIKKTLENFDDIDDTVTSIGNQIGKNNKLFESMSLLSASMQGSMKSVGLFVKELGPDASKFKKETFKTADAYKSLGNVIAVNSKKLKKQQLMG